MMLFTDDIKRNQSIIGVLFAVACAILFIVVFLTGTDTEVMKLRFYDADDIFNGHTTDFEYPPFAMIFILIPRVFATTPFWYGVWFAAEMAIFFMIGLYAICKIANILGKDQKKFMLLYTLLTMLLFEFVIDRYDIIPVALTLLAIYCYLSKKYTWAFVLLAFGAMIKLYPALLFPVFLIPLMMGREWKEALKGTVAFAAVSFATILPVLIFQPDMLSYFIGYHADRPLQIESVAASFLIPFVMLGLIGKNFEYTYGSDNLVGPIPDAIASWLTPLMGACILILCALYAVMLKKIKGKGDKNDRLYLFAAVSLLAVMIFIMVGKVMSTQYLLWVVPLLLFLFMFTSDVKREKKVLLLFIASIIVAQVQFGLNAGILGGAEGLSDPGNAVAADIVLILIIVKNILLLAVSYYVVRSSYERYISVKQQPKTH